MQADRDVTPHAKAGLQVESKHFATQQDVMPGLSASNGVMPALNSLLISPATTGNASAGPASARGRTKSITTPLSPTKPRAMASVLPPSQSHNEDNANSVQPARGRLATQSPSTAARLRPGSNNSSPSRAAMPSGVPNFSYKEHPPYSTVITNAADDEEIDLQVNVDDDGDESEAISAELQQLYAAFQTCIDLREKYITLSCQRLEDNPINYDGHFAPAQGSTSTSASVPVSPLFTPAQTPGGTRSANGGTATPNGLLSPDTALDVGQSAPFKPWQIYPAPPKPHWEAHEGNEHASQAADPHVPAEQRFDFEACKIPTEHPYSFGIDAQGVYQIYKDETVGACGALGVCHG